MGIVTTGKSGTALLLAGSSAIPAYIAIGSGSAAVTVNRTGLINEFNRRDVGSPDASTPRYVTYTSAWSSVLVSGLSMSELGTFTPASGGKAWSIDGFEPIVFDGTNELQVDVTFEVF